MLGLKRDDELTYNRHVTHYCFASLRVSDFVFFLDTQKWLDFESHYIHIVLCVGRGTAALLSLHFLYFVPSIEFIRNVNCPLKYFHEFKIFIFFFLCFLNMYLPQGIQLPIPKLPIHHICLRNLLFVKCFCYTTLSDNSHFRKVSPISPNFARLCFWQVKKWNHFC